MNNNMENKVKPFGIKRNLFFVKGSFILLFRKFIEYKENLYSSFFFFVIWYASQLAFILILSQNFGTEIGWSQSEFILFTILVNAVWSIIGLFNWGNGLFFSLSKGNLNVLLTKPLSTKFKYYFHDLNEVGFFYLISNFLYILFLIFYFNLAINYNLLGVIVLIINTLFFTFLWLAVDSFNFYSLRFSELIRPIGAIEHNLQYYPGNFFQETKIKYFLNLLPLYFVGTLLVPLFTQNILTKEIYFQIFLLIILTIISYLILVFNWHYGLKKYEAFG